MFKTPRMMPGAAPAYRTVRGTRFQSRTSKRLRACDSGIEPSAITPSLIPGGQMAPVPNRVTIGFTKGKSTANAEWTA